MEKPTDKISFLIAYNNRLHAEGLKSMIDDDAHYQVTDMIENGLNLIQAINSKKIDLLIIDLVYPAWDSIEYIKEIKRNNKRLKILLISDLIKNGMLADMLNTGIEGYILQTCSKRDLNRAITKILDNERFICSNITSRVFRKIGQNSFNKEKFILTVREKEVLSLLIKMNSNKSIAEQLDISEMNVKTHRKNIMKKFNSKNLLSLVRYACRENLLNGKNDDFCKGCPYRYCLVYN